MIREIIDIIVELFYFIADILSKLFSYLIDKFFDLNLYEKIIVINTIPAFFAVVLPMARHYMLGTSFRLNNPLAVYLIGIVFLMFLTHIFRERAGFLCLVIRIIANLYYLFWVIYIHAIKDISKGPYELSFGYYLNIVVPLVYALFSFFNFRYDEL